MVCEAAVDAPITTVPSEGIAEFASDLVIKCQGGTPTPPAQTIPSVTLRAYLNTNATGRLLSTSPDLSEALLLIDEPAPLNQLACPDLPCEIEGTGGGVGSDPHGPYNGSQGRYNVYQAAVIVGNVLEWAGIPLDPPPAGQTRTLRMTNIRADIDALASSTALGSADALAMFVTSIGLPEITIINPTQFVGFFRTGLSFTTTYAPLSSLADHNASGATPSTDFTISFSEGFPHAFKTRTIASQPNDVSASANQNVPGRVYPSASGFYNSSLGGTYTNAGLTTQGTRLVAHFENVPLGVNLFVTEQPIGGSGTARVQLVSTGPRGDGPYDPIPATANGFASITAYNGSAVAVWEVVSASGAEPESVQFGVAVSYSINLLELGTATVRGSLGPISDVSAASLTDPVPRYFENAAQPAFTITDHGIPVVGAVVNAANFAPDAPLAPGSVAAIFGSNLTSQATINTATSLPEMLGGTAVHIDGIPAPIYAVTPGQVNIQIPWGLGGVSPTSLQITVDGVDSKPVPIQLADTAPYLFVSTNGQGIVSRQLPVKAGSPLTFYGTGLGPVHHQPLSGEPALDSTSSTLNAAAVSIGGIPAEVVFSGLLPKVVGVYEVRIKIPQALAFGPSIPVKLSIAGLDSNTVLIDLP